jgi:hypothetical protein
MREASESDPDEAESVIVSSIDRSEGYDQFLIANTSRDDQWLGIRQSEALSLRAWQ